MWWGARELGQPPSWPWAEQRAEWADSWREQGLEGTDRELSTAHVGARFDMDLEEFEKLVVDWSSEREKRALRQLLAGPIEAAQDQIDAATDAVRDQG
jgi:hypothetical protein